MNTHPTPRNPAQGAPYQRRDGTLLNATDLAECLPIHPTELHDLAWLTSLMEDWLLHCGDNVLADLAAFHRSCDTAYIIDELGTQALKLHRLLKPNT
ncbi:hypothetical protein AB0F17_60235 [Nonomuraea sp. NPDC026600]|uniref:hypothetical protein n=1 Tax=Nonomuraea sp. NPDC026600 TaxID=3155363 RepID=UPI0033F8D2B0